VLADGGATKDLPALENEGFQARSAQVGGGRKAVMPAADHDGIVFGRHSAEYIEQLAAGPPPLAKAAGPKHLDKE
jgi:hypothetical protein